MALQLAALALFVGVFVVATARKAHIGVLMFAAACGAGIWLAQMPIDDVIAGFPLDILVLLVGVTYFFGIAHSNGTIDRVIEAVLARVGDRVAWLPPVFFVLTGGIAAMGSPLGGLVMAPVGMLVADKRGIDPMLMGLSMGTGLSAGAFAPTSLFGLVAFGTAREAGIALNPLLLFLVALVVNIALFVVAFCMFGGIRLLRHNRVHAEAVSRTKQQVGSGVGGNRSGGTPAHPAADDPAPQPSEAQSRFTANQIATLGCMIGLVTAVIGGSLAGLNPDVGVLGFAFGAVLTLLDPDTGTRAITKIDWSTVLLVGGIITYVGVLEHLDAVDLFGEFARGMSVPLIAALFICLIAGLVSAFASTTGMLAALVPLALPLVAEGDIPGWALICALAVCASIVDVSPFSTVGATFVASTVDVTQRPRMTRLLMRWGLSMVVIGPIALVATLIAPGMGF